MNSMVLQQGNSTQFQWSRVKPRSLESTLRRVIPLFSRMENHKEKIKEEKKI